MIACRRFALGSPGHVCRRPPACFPRASQGGAGRGGAGRGGAGLTLRVPGTDSLAALSRAKGSDSRSGAGAAADGAVFSCGLRRRERHVDVFRHALPARHFVHGVVPPHLPRAGARGVWVRRAAPGSSAGGREEGGGAWVPGARSTFAMSRARGGFASP